MALSKLLILYLDQITRPLIMFMKKRLIKVYHPQIQHLVIHIPKLPGYQYYQSDAK